MRKEKLEKWLQALLLIPTLLNSWDVQFFLEIKKNTITSDSIKKRILIPLPDADFDPTEVGVPWKILVSEGFEVVFATEQLLINPKDFISNQVCTEKEPRGIYLEMEQDPQFCSPIKWDDIDPKSFDAFLLGGGHAPGMRQYLESTVLQEKIVEFWQLNRPIAAICHGTLLLSRCKDPQTGKSLLFKRKTTTLPKFMEDVAYTLTKWKYERRYRTYELHCELEVRGFLESAHQFEVGPTNLAKGTAFDDSAAFVVEDGNYLSARWPGDAYLLGKKLLDKLYG